MFIVCHKKTRDVEFMIALGSSRRSLTGEIPRVPWFFIDCTIVIGAPYPKLWGLNKPWL